VRRGEKVCREEKTATGRMSYVVGCMKEVTRERVVLRGAEMKRHEVMEGDERAWGGDAETESAGQARDEDE
jgi:hypothetical protein